MKRSVRSIIFDIIGLLCLMYLVFVLTGKYIINKYDINVSDTPSSCINNPKINGGNEMFDKLTVPLKEGHMVVFNETKRNELHNCDFVEASIAKVVLITDHITFLNKLDNEGNLQPGVLFLKNSLFFDSVTSFSANTYANIITIDGQPVTFDGLMKWSN